MEPQNNLFGLPDHIAQPRKRSICGCFISDCHCVKIKAIENYLRSGKELTSIDCVKLFKTIDGRKFISILRGRGMNILDTWDSNGKTRFKRYKLVKDGK